MGIPRLTRHLRPFSEAVLLEGRLQKRQDGVGHVHSVVIDGPSLVYHVFWRLLSWTDSRTEFPDAQPTCSEVSCGVMIYLLLLTITGVKIERICFDGALPSEKRKTRLLRLEKSRRKIELLRLKPQSALQNSSGYSGKRAIALENILQGRALPARYNDLPENPFMVPAVFEDLKLRWNKENIVTAARDALYMQSIEIKDFPWADITVMVPGEADAYCAYFAKCTNSSILTNDSDLLLHDLGPRGSLIFLNSVEVVGWDPHRPSERQIRAMSLSPALIARRLGVTDILRFAFELKTHPDAGTAELVQRANSSCEGSENTPEYQAFIQEYQQSMHGFEATNLQSLPHLDARVSELFWQFEWRQGHMVPDAPHMYLAVLNEDHARRCAWAEGRLYRSLAYSVLNASRPVSNRVGFINEFARRGGRIAVDKVVLGNENWIMTETGVLLVRLRSVQNKVEVDTALPAYWIMFALCELHDADSSLVTLDHARLSRFLTLGYMNENFDWKDMQLTAQIQAVLYSLRILGQLLESSMDTCDNMAELKSILSNLPPLHMIMGPTPSMMDETLNISCVSALVHRLLQGLGKEENCSEIPDAVGFTKQQLFSYSLVSQQDGSRVGNHRPRKINNMYDFLPME
ncbi:XPG domain containing-domain-containing protein [Aspergillus caelatus]|uniref:XPG domain containing-domain-containing protein n=1 Tax=Aspergillus caelatus TaxID=61420 RepID=A0A5N6ZNH2_9EURO|nr:XPG domain containing-domain-containing protein [Aspergillus caelatus]KAE8357710.1 XPG domain containing-domain-containing protein [Aspergillus caelatus]